MVVNKDQTSIKEKKMTESEKFVRMNYAEIEKQIMEARMARSAYIGGLIASFLIKTMEYMYIVGQAILTARSAAPKKQYQMFDA